MLFVYDEQAPRSKCREKHRIGARTSVQAAIIAAWQQKEEARRRLHTNPNNVILRKEVKKDAVLSSLWAHVCKL